MRRKRSPDWRKVHGDAFGVCDLCGDTPTHYFPVSMGVRTQVETCGYCSKVARPDHVVRIIKARRAAGVRLTTKGMEA